MNEINLNIEIVNELNEYHSISLPCEYLNERQLSNNEIHNEKEEEESNKNIKTLTIKNMNEFMYHVKLLRDYREECNFNEERISKVRRVIGKDIHVIEIFIK
ncbi:UNVERIFIED_CONTAM: hypothetical protein NCL1_18169 [Trichonephila clavipes]